MQHEQIWTGLDPTAFNPSKRTSKDGRPRWPSTESVVRALDAVGANFSDLAGLIEDPSTRREDGSAPLIGFAQAGADGFFNEDGFPIGEDWEDVYLPGLSDDPVYALEIADDSMEPAYRAGDRIVVSPSAPVRNGDRVVAKTCEGEVMAKVLARRNARDVELHSLNRAHEPRVLRSGEVAWIARILWASQ